jgi:hypothetical protein
VEPDACAEGIGAMLMQQGQPIAYLCKALGDKHKALSIYEKRVLGIDYGSREVASISSKARICHPITELANYMRLSKKIFRRIR